jgi:cystathionine beta-lyase
MKTLALRVEKAQSNAMRVAEFLQRHPMVTKLYYAGMPPETGDVLAMKHYKTHFGQAAGAGCVMSFTTGSVSLSRRFIDALRIFKLTVSFGSVHSLCEMPCMMSHASVPLDQRECASIGKFSVLEHFLL